MYCKNCHAGSKQIHCQLCHQFTHVNYYRDVTHNNRKIKLQIWDTAGQERYRSLAHVYYSKAVAIIILYDITKHHTYQNVIDRWIPEVSL